MSLTPKSQHSLLERSTCPKNRRVARGAGLTQAGRRNEHKSQKACGFGSKDRSLGKMLPGPDGMMGPQDQPLPEPSCPFCPGITENIPQIHTLGSGG